MACNLRRDASYNQGSVIKEMCDINWEWLLILHLKY